MECGPSKWDRKHVLYQVGGERVAPGRRTSKEYVGMRAASAAVAAVLLICVAYSWSTGHSAYATQATQALWQGKPAHHALKSTEMAWGKPLASFHYEPAKFKLKLGISLAQHNKNNQTNTSDGLSFEHSRDSLNDYWNRQIQEEEKKLAPAENEVKQVVAEQRSSMSADDARKNAALLPAYLQWVEAQYDAKVKAVKAAEKEHRKQAEMEREKEADNKRIAHEAVKAAEKEQRRQAESAKATKAAAEPANDGRHMSDSKQRQSASDYFDTRIKEEEQAEASRRAIRIARAEEIEHEKETDDKRIAHEVADSFGAGDRNPDTVANIKGTLIQTQRSVLLLNARPASNHAFDGSLVHGWEDGPVLGRGVDPVMKRIAAFRLHQLKLQQQSKGALLKHDTLRKEQATSRETRLAKVS